ncbi:MAG: carbohydrate-binding protein [Cyanobacteria bacterium J06629_18]
MKNDSLAVNLRRALFSSAALISILGTGILTPSSAEAIRVKGSKPRPNRFYKLTTMFLEKENKCLEGNKLSPRSTLKGAAFMDNCQKVSGQSWKLVPVGNGYFRLKTQFLEKENKCFEGNKLSPRSTLKGAAFMDNCQNVSGQLWKLVPAGNGYFRLKTMFLEKENKCLEGNKLSPRSTLKGAAFMDNCQNVSGQLWKFKPIKTKKNSNN